MLFHHEHSLKKSTTFLTSMAVVGICFMFGMVILMLLNFFVIVHYL